MASKANILLVDDYEVNLELLEAYSGIERHSHEYLQSLYGGGGLCAD